MSSHNTPVAFNGSDSAVSASKYTAALTRKNTHVIAFLAHSTRDVVNSRAAWVPAADHKIIKNANAEVLNELETRFDKGL